DFLGEQNTPPQRIAKDLPKRRNHVLEGVVIVIEDDHGVRRLPPGPCQADSPSRRCRNSADRPTIFPVEKCAHYCLLHPGLCFHPASSRESHEKSGGSRLPPGPPASGDRSDPAGGSGQTPGKPPQAGSRR